MVFSLRSPAAAMDFFKAAFVYRKPPEQRPSDWKQPPATRSRSSPSLNKPEKLNPNVKIPPKTPPRPKQEKSSPSLDDKAELGTKVRKARSRQGATGKVDSGTNIAVKKSDNTKKSKKNRRSLSTDAVDEGEMLEEEKAITSQYFPMVEKPAPRAAAATVTVTMEEKTVDRPRIEKTAKYPKKKAPDPDEVSTDFEEVAAPRRPAVSRGSRKTARDRLAQAKTSRKETNNSSSSSSDRLPEAE